MKKLNHILQWDNLDLLGIALFLSIISLFIPYAIPIWVIYIMYAKKQFPWMLFILIFMIICLLFIKKSEDIIPEMIYQEAVVVDQERFDTYTRFTVMIHQKKYHMSLFEKGINIGDILILKGMIKRYENATVPFGFDAYTYYRSKGIDGYIDLESYEIIRRGITFYTLRDQWVTFYQKQEISPYALNILFGEPLASESKDIYQQLGISYLLSLSGLHLYVICQLIKKILYYASVSDKKQEIIIFLFYAFFAYLHRFDLGILRLLIMQGLLMSNDYFSWRKSRFELLQVTYIFIVITNISLLFSQGLLISYMILTIIYLTKVWFQPFDGYTKQILFNGFLMIWLIPFYSTVDPLKIILIPLLMFAIVYGYTLASLMVGLYPPLSPFFEVYIQTVESGLYWIQKHSMSLIIPKMEVVIIVCFYVLIICFFLIKSKVKKGWISLMTFGLVFLSSSLSLAQERLIFLDVGQGDSTIVETKDCVALIDSFHQTYDYLKHQGKTHIDYLFLTHSDIDHIKDADRIIKDFNVKNLIGSSEVKEYPTFLMTMKKARAGDVYPCGDIRFNILGPIKAYEDENAASLVIQFYFKHQHVLLTGDIDVNAELDLIHRYQETLKSDILKIAHHGSNTSSSTLFLMYVNPKVVIISSGRENRYGFPHDEVLDRLLERQVVIYRTDLKGSIVFDPERKGEKWYFHLPFSPRFWYNMYRVRGRMYG